jgi:predicted phosphodiesterase
MYKIQPLSDLHVEFYKDNTDIRIEDTDSDLIILAGDIYTGVRGIKWLLEQKINKPIIYVQGNHCFYKSSYPNNTIKLKEAAKGTNIHVLENDYYIYKDLVVLGCTLWTDYKLFEPVTPQALTMNECYNRMNDFNQIRNSDYNYRKLAPRDLLFAHKQSIDFLKTYLDIFKDYNIGIVTHHPPTIKCIDPKYHKDLVSAAYASNLDEFVAYSGAKFWVSGHSHYSVDFMLGNTRVISNPSGYWPNHLNPNFIKDLVITID